MNKRKILPTGVLAVSGLFLLSKEALADSPLPTPTVRTVWSMDKKFCAVMNPDKKIITVYRVSKDGKKTALWAMYGWFRVAGLSNNGKHLVAGHGGMNLLPLNHKKDEVMLYFFNEGELINYVTLDQLIKDQSNLQRTVSHLHWGNYLGFDEEGRYIVETVENHKIAFDVTTGKPHNHITSPKGQN